MNSSLLAIVIFSGLPNAASNATIPPGLVCLSEAYPSQICGVKPNALVFCDGTEMAWDDGKPKRDLETLLDRADLEDQMSVPYPAGRRFPTHPPPGSDPGRIRHEAFFTKIYGATSKKVQKTLKRVPWLDGKMVLITSVNGVDRKLAAVVKDLERLEKSVLERVWRSSGGFYWRKIRGTGRLSTHSFGIAIDVGVAHSDYWRWRKPKKDGTLRYRNRIPLEIVDVFERHGFIWGGKWYHFDTMHFEYRPELLHPRCARR